MDFTDEFDFEDYVERLFDTLKLTDQQRSAVRARLEGKTQAEAARLGGYAPSADGTYHVAGSKLFASKRVKRALAGAKKLLDRPVEAIGDFEELHKLVWQEARNGDGANRMRAQELLLKIQERAEARRHEESPERIAEILQRIGRTHPDLARSLAAAMGQEIRNIPPGANSNGEGGRMTTERL